MALDFGTTAGNVLRYLKGDNKVADVDAGFQTLAEDVAAKMAGFLVDTAAKRPAATVVNRFFKASDTGLLAMDTGAAWAPIVGPGAGAPAAFVGRSFNTSYEPSKERPTIVKLQIAAGFGKACSATIKVNGVEVDGFNIGTETNSEVKAWGTTLWLRPGDTWEAIAGGTTSAIKSSYQTL